MVLIDPLQLTYTSADGTALTIAAAGATATVTGVTAGSHKVYVTEKESGKTGSVTLTVAAITPPPAANPHILVADTVNADYNKRIVRINPAAFDDPLTANLAAFNVPANGSGNVFKRLAVAVDSGTTPHIYFTGVYFDATGNVTDAAIFRMDDMKGTNLTRYGTFGSGNGQFSYPVSISVR